MAARLCARLASPLLLLASDLTPWPVCDQATSRAVSDRLDVASGTVGDRPEREFCSLLPPAISLAGATPDLSPERWNAGCSLCQHPGLRL